MFRTPLCDLLGIEAPVIGAPMAFISGPQLAAAVSNAGGLGLMSFSANPPPVLREQIRCLRGLTRKPFGVNVLLSGPRLPYPVEEAVEVCLEERIPVLSTFWGDPLPIIPRARQAGVKIIHQTGSVREAERVARAGVDAIVAQGLEAGGHVAGEVTTFALVPRVADAAAPVPVIAAGGIADARGVAAALALGAQAAVIGTRLLATEEAYAHPGYKEKILAAQEEDTVLTTLFGHGWPNAPHRTLRTPFVEQWLSEESRGSEQRTDEPCVGETKIGGHSVPVLRFMGFPPTPDATGDIDSMSFLAGQGVGLVKEIKPAAEVVRELIEGAREIFSSLAANRE